MGRGLGGVALWAILFAKQSESLESFFESFAICLIGTVYSDVVSLSKAALLYQMVLSVRKINPKAFTEINDHTWACNLDWVNLL